jgi:hypothetical protein
MPDGLVARAALNLDPETGIDGGLENRQRMPRDPTECRAIATGCEALAAKSKDPELRERLVELAAGWTHLATVLETTQEITARFGTIKPPDQETPAAAEPGKPRSGD